MVFNGQRSLLYEVCGVELSTLCCKIVQVTFTKNELTSQLHILNVDHFIVMLNLALRLGRNDKAQGCK